MASVRPDDDGLAEPFEDDFQLEDLDTGESAQVYDVNSGEGASEIVVDSKAYQSLDDEVTEAISNLTHSYQTTEGVPKTILTPSTSAVGLAPELLLPRGDQADAVLAGHAEVKEGKAPYVVYVLLVARVASRPYTSTTSSAKKPSPHAAAPNVPAAWTVFRRYRDFDALNDALRKRGIVVPMSLPGKRWIMQSDDDFLSKRQAGLSGWLAAALALCSGSSMPAELHAFLTESADTMPRGLDTAQYASAIATVEGQAQALLQGAVASNSSASSPIAGEEVSGTGGTQLHTSGSNTSLASATGGSGQTIASTPTKQLHESEKNQKKLAHVNHQYFGDNASVSSTPQSTSRPGSATSATSSTPTGVTIHRAHVTLLPSIQHDVLVTSTTATAQESGSTSARRNMLPPVAAPKSQASSMEDKSAAVQIRVNFPKAGLMLTPIVPTAGSTPTGSPEPPVVAAHGPPGSVPVAPAPVRVPGATSHSTSPDARVVKRMRACSMLPNHISLDDFELMKVVGKGSFGKVLLVRRKADVHASDPKFYAMKILSKSNVVKRKQVEHTITERRVLGYTRHPFIIQLHYAFQTRDKLFLVVDYAGGGEMFFHLGRLGRFKESMARFYSAQLVLALGHLHKLGVVYRDLKPENVLFDELGHVKLADFGLSKEGITESTEGTKSFCGTPEYLAPEVLNRTGHGTAVDWWSLGSLIYEMLTGLPPWYTRDRKLLYERLRSAPLEFPSHVSEHARSIISSLLVRDPSARLGAVRDAAELMEHPFFSGMDWRALYKRELTPPFLPQVRAGEGDTRYFDAQFTEMPANIALEDEKESPTNPPNSLFANFTYDGPSMLASRPSRGLSFSLAPSPTVGGGSFSMEPAGRDGVPVTGPGGATLRRVGSNNASQLGVSYGGGAPQRTISSDIASGMASVKFNPGKEALDKEKLPVLPSGPSGLTQLLKGSDSARSSPRPDALPAGVSRPVAVHGASPSFRAAAPTGVPAVSPILQYPSDTRGYSNRVITGATVSPVVAPASYHSSAGGYGHHGHAHYSRGSPSAVTQPLAIPLSGSGGYDSLVPRPPSASARALNVTRGATTARQTNPETLMTSGAGSARKGYSTAR